MSFRLQTAKEIAERFGENERKILRYAREGLIPHVRIGRLVRFDPEQLEHWIQRGGQALPGGWRREQK